MKKLYPFAVEIAADLGMFARLDSGSESFSEIVPSSSSARGIIESICWGHGVDVVIEAIGICFTPSYANYMFNSFSPIRKSVQISGDNACQLRYHALVSPRYILIGHYSNQKNIKGDNIAHSCQVRLARRLKRGISFHTPFMGLKDFPLNYCGSPKSKILDINLEVPFLSSVIYENNAPSFVHNSGVIKNGVVKYGDCDISIKNGVINFEDLILSQQLSKFIGKC